MLTFLGLVIFTCVFPDISVLFAHPSFLTIFLGTVVREKLHGSVHFCLIGVGAAWV